jgi:hypothetical protein
MRRRAADELQRFHADIEPASVREEQCHDLRFPRITAQFAIEFYEWVVSWCDPLEQELTVRPRRRARSR